MLSSLRSRLLIVLLVGIASGGGVVDAADGETEAGPFAPSASPSHEAGPSCSVEPMRRGPFNVRRFALRDLSIDELSCSGEPDEYWQATRSPVARLLLEGAITTMHEGAARFGRPGRTSFHSSRSKSVIRSYHDIHVWQLRLLGQVTGDAFFTRLRDHLAIDQPPKAYVQGRPALDGVRVIAPRPPLALRMGAFPPLGPWSDVRA